MSPVEKYLERLVEIRSSGDATDETSYYSALDNLLNEVGKELKPRVRCILQLKNRGAGHPDGGLYTPDQFQKGDAEPLPGQKPTRGAVEIKSTRDDAFVTAAGEQVTRYWRGYGQVLVTNYRDFVLVERDRDGKPVNTESFRFSTNENEFWLKAARAKKTAQQLGEQFIEFLKRVMLSSATLSDPFDVAWFLASYARDARARIEDKRKLPAMASVRSALESALGLEFRGEKGEHFFRSSLIQTIFYGIFSAWVLWSREIDHASSKRFEWRMASWKLRVPMIRVLFEQIATASKLEDLGLIQVLDWSESRLNSVARREFFRKFEQDHAVQYFYEPFLEAFDPELRKQLGVWYTPDEVVRYMVARTHAVVRDELGIEDGLADPRVYVLDPACGTGAFLVEVLNCIRATLEEKGSDALLPKQLKQAASERIFGFEILPAPFVISHLQIGMALEKIGASWDEKKQERARVYLTNSLTGWLPPKDPKDQIVFPEMEAERDAANNVKQKTPVLVVIGNPPYDGFAEVGIAEEQELIAPYRRTRRTRKPEGQGLNNLFVRFFRIAERKIVEGTGSGIVCLITNYRWLDGLSHPGMRERFLEEFDHIWVDSLNGDKYRTGKVTPEGLPDPSIFSTPYNREGIQNGTAISLLSRRVHHEPTRTIFYRDFWGVRKRQQLLESLLVPEKYPFEEYEPRENDGFVFMPREIARGYSQWPKLTDLLPIALPGVKTSRDSFLVGIDKAELEQRIGLYFDPQIGHDEIRRKYPLIMKDSGRFVAERTRDSLRHRSEKKGGIKKYCYRPFDVRWLYWDPDTKLLDEKRTELIEQLFPNNVFLEGRQKESIETFSRGYVTSVLADNFGNGLSSFFPLFVKPNQQQGKLGDNLEAGVQPNLTLEAREYMQQLNGKKQDLTSLFFHIVAIIHSPSYRSEHGEALKQDWPRLPLPDKAKTLSASAELGKSLGILLDTEKDVRGVTSGKVRNDLRLIAPLTTLGSKSVGDEDLEVTADWGRPQEDRVMPGNGKIVERPFSDDEKKSLSTAAAEMVLPLENVLSLIGRETCDVYLNESVYWKNVPVKVWDYTIGGYQVLKKWLSYREKNILGRPLRLDEVHYFRDMVRRITAICLLQPALDANYAAVKADTYLWPTQNEIIGTE